MEGKSLNETQISNFVNCFLQKNFGQKTISEYLDILIREREERVKHHRRWRALCKEEKTNFKSIFNEDKYRMTAKKNPNFNTLQDVKENKDNLMKMMQAEDKEIEKKLCKAEGFILSGLPEKLDMMIELEKKFMNFDFEDLRERKQSDFILNELELYFGRKLKKKRENCKKSIFDLVIVIRSKFDKLIKLKLNKFEIVEKGKEIDLNYMTESDKKHVAEFVNKIRIDDNVYSLPSKYHSNLKESENICKMYSENFKSNADLTQKQTQLIIDVDDEEDIAFSIKQVEDVLDKIMQQKEDLFQNLIVESEKRDEVEGEQLSKKTKKENLFIKKTNINEEDLKDITFDFINIFKKNIGDHPVLKCKES
jgi:flagellar biosynthesis/type III secretory pathway chaperone